MDGTPAAASDVTSMIQNVVVIFGENRSFDILYGNFPGANGIASAKKSSANYQKLHLDCQTVQATLPAVGDSTSSPRPPRPSRP